MKTGFAMAALVALLLTTAQSASGNATSPVWRPLQEIGKVKPWVECVWMQGPTGPICI